MVNQTSSEKSSKPSGKQPLGGAGGLRPTMAELLAQTGMAIPSIKRGQEVSGKVLSATRSEILVDIGAKSEGIIFGREIAAAGDLVAKLVPGDTIEATVMQPENDAGQVVLSLRKFSGAKRWLELEEMREGGDEIEVLALEVNRGGVICEYFGIRGFLPASQLSQSASSGTSGGQEFPARLGDLIGKRLNVTPIEVDQSSNRLIFSQKRPDKKDLDKLVKLLGKIKIREKFSGVVTAILPFGIFVELKLDGAIGQSGNQAVRKSETESNDQSTRDPDNRIEGLVHISEISWEKIEEPVKLFSVGQEVEVIVIAKDLESGRLNLSIKQLLEDPFIKASEKYSKEQKVSGTVSKVTPFGVFVNLDNVTLSDGTSGLSGIEGLIHISKIPPNVTFNVGEDIECEIESVDTRTRRISLVPSLIEKPVLYR